MLQIGTLYKSPVMKEVFLFLIAFLFLMFEGLWGGAVGWGWLGISFLLLSVKGFWT